MSRLTLAIPSKGRLMEQTTDMFASAGLIVRKVGAFYRCIANPHPAHM